MCPDPVRLQLNYFTLLVPGNEHPPPQPTPSLPLHGQLTTQVYEIFDLRTWFVWFINLKCILLHDINSSKNRIKEQKIEYRHIDIHSKFLNNETTAASVQLKETQRVITLTRVSPMQSLSVCANIGIRTIQTSGIYSVCQLNCIGMTVTAWTKRCHMNT